MDNKVNDKVDFIVTVPDDPEQPIVATGTSYQQLADREEEILATIMSKKNDMVGDQKKYSVVPSSDTNSNTLTLDYIDQLASGINSSLDNVNSANQLIVQNVNEEGLIGYTFDCISANIPSEYTIIPGKGTDDEKDDSETKAEAKKLIEQFNEAVDIRAQIDEIIRTTYLEGNCPVVLRSDDGFAIDILPLTMAYPSDYKQNGEPILEVNMAQIRTKLQKTYRKDKKNKALYFENIKKEVQNTFPNEVYKAYANGESYVRLDFNHSGCVRINSLGRKFGVSPLFRSLRPKIVLSNIEAADVSSSKARQKQIIFQKLSDKLMGDNAKYKGFAEQEAAHATLMAALKSNLCAYTAPAYVADLKFVTATTSGNTEASTQMKQYTSKLLQSLGIAFVDTEVGSYMTANISLDQILRTLNKISENTEKVINKFYRTVCVENGFDACYAPKIKISPAETMEWKLRKDIAQFVYNTLNASRETTFKMMGLDLADETTKRQQENDASLDEVFSPRATSFNSSGNDLTSPGRTPSSDNTQKQAYDNELEKNK